MIFVFHGFGGSNDFIMYTSNFNSISERENFIVVYPQGSSFWGYPHWNVGGWTNGSSVNDVEFIDFLGIPHAHTLLLLVAWLEPGHEPIRRARI